MHRDITPMNVFVCKNKKLKLGDFGLARHVLAGKMVTASAFTPFFVSKRMAEGERRYWRRPMMSFRWGSCSPCCFVATPTV